MVVRPRYPQVHDAFMGSPASSHLYQRRGSAPTLGSPSSSFQGVAGVFPQDGADTLHPHQGFGGRPLSARGLSRRARLIYGTLVIAALGALAMMCVWAPQRVPIFRTYMMRRIDVRAMDIWERYVADHPVSIDSRYPWGEMGFRSRIYSEILQRRFEPDVDALDESLWSFMPGLSSVRRPLALGISSRLGPLQTASRTRGIVTVATNETIGDTVQLIGVLRESIKTKLPIEVFHHGEEELGSLLSEALSSLPGVTVIDIEAQGLFDSETVGFENIAQQLDDARQALALLATSFAQAIYISPGTIPIAGPDVIFADQGFRTHGSLLFRAQDLPQRAGAGRLISYLKQQLDNLTPSASLSSSPWWNFDTNWMIEPNFVAVDRRKPKVFTALLLNAWLHTRDVRLGSWHLHFPECTRESLWLAFELSGAHANFAGAPPGGVGLFTGDWSDLQRNDEIVCPAIPLHFLSRADDTLMPLWVQAPTSQLDSLLRQPQGNAWTSHGHWEIIPDRGWCLTSATMRKPEGDVLSVQALKDALSVAQSYLSMFEPLIRRAAQQKPS